MTQTSARSARRPPAARQEPVLPAQGELPVDSWDWLHELAEEHRHAVDESDTT
jgi:hypothetical protein